MHARHDLREGSERSSFQRLIAAILVRTPGLPIFCFSSLALLLSTKEQKVWLLDIWHRLNGISCSRVLSRATRSLFDWITMSFALPFFCFLFLNWFMETIGTFLFMALSLRCILMCVKY